MNEDKSFINTQEGPSLDPINCVKSNPVFVKTLSECEGDIIPKPSLTQTNGVDIEETEDTKNPLKYIFKRLIPQEIQDLVFRPLDLNSKKASRLVCKEWKTLVDGTLSFDILISDSNIQNVIQFGSLDQVGSLTTSSFHGNYPENGFGFPKVSKITLLPCRPKGESSDRKKIGISEGNLEHILEEFWDIEYLYVHSGAVQNLTCPSFLTEVALPELKRLEISAGNMDGYGALICCELLKNTFPKLTALDIGLLVGSESIFHMPLMYEETYDFISRHGENLVDLSLAFETGIDERTLSEEELSIDILAMDLNELPNLGDKIEVVNKLKCFCFFPSYYESRSRYVLGKKLLLAQTCLITLEVKNLAEPNIGIWECLPRVYAACSETLVNIKISGCYCPIQEASREFNCNCVKNCLRLKSFELDVCGVTITNMKELPNQIKCLYLGQMLTEEQIVELTVNMRELSMLCLPQGQSAYNPLIPKVTEDIFRMIIKRMLNLKILVLRKQGSSAFKRIRKVISYSQGLDIVECAHGLYKVRIDRELLDVERI